MALKGEYYRGCPNCKHTKLMAQFYEDLWTYSQCTEDNPIPIQPIEVPNEEVPNEETNLVEGFECKCLECEQSMETTRWFKCLIANMISEVVENEVSNNEEEQVDSVTKPKSHGSLSMAFQCGYEDEDITQESPEALTMVFQCGYENHQSGSED
ncbi:hypothetical protein KC19_12G087800 [Ceratodon purpureus]|uniref:Uncharacterized protein n=1 Tax=Ceratodon purpureus TaxID=3225 RepID=A0A8T0G5P7_CERPU|nr:hypothetical protein KC19_12G087800 [Ceratodon purpureus]